MFPETVSLKEYVYLDTTATWLPQACQRQSRTSHAIDQHSALLHVVIARDQVH